MKKTEKELLIIIPAYNEEKTIGSLLDSLKGSEIASISDILVMNDASTDKTESVAKEHGATVINHVVNLGYGNGLQVGYKYAVKKGYRYLLQLDADGQHDICNAMWLYNRIKTADENGKYPDIVIGSRYMEGSAEYNPGVVKKFAYSLFRGIIRLFTGKRISDPTSGLQIISRRAFTFYSKFSNFDDKYPDANMLLQMLLLGYRIEEIPAVMHYRTTGKSMHSGMKPFIYMFRMTYSIIAVWLMVRVYHGGNLVNDEQTAEENKT